MNVMIFDDMLVTYPYGKVSLVTRLAVCGNVNPPAQPDGAPMQRFFASAALLDKHINSL
jgi:hypothetical protein